MLFLATSIPRDAAIPSPDLFDTDGIDEADRDGDGEVSEEDFIRIMKKTSLY